MAKNERPPTRQKRHLQFVRKERSSELEDSSCESSIQCGGGPEGEPRKRTATDCTGAARVPLTSSSDSLCGTEKQLVTSTECLSTVPVREDCLCYVTGGS